MVEDAGHAAHTQRADNLGILPAVARPIKIVFLGAGSGFFHRLFTDVLNIPGAESGEMVLVDVDTERLELAEQVGKMLVEKMSRGWTVRVRRAVSPSFGTVSPRRPPRSRRSPARSCGPTGPRRASA